MFNLLATINDKQILLTEFPVSIDNKIEAYNSTSELVFVEQILSDSETELNFENVISEDVILKFTFPDKTIKTLTVKLPVTIVPEKAFISENNLKKAIEIFDGFELLNPSLDKSKLNIFISVYSLNDVFKYPDFPTSKIKLSFDETSNSIPFIFSKDSLYDIRFIYENTTHKFLHLSETPTIYYCGSDEVRRFFANENIFDNFYKDEELIFIIWKKSLEAHAISGLTYNLAPSPHAVSIFEKYIKYSVACDVLFSLLSNTNVDDDKMFQSISKIQLSDLNISGDVSTPYDSYSTSYMRFLREKDSLVKDMKLLVGFKTKITHYNSPDKVQRKGTGWF